MKEDTEDLKKEKQGQANVYLYKPGITSDSKTRAAAIVLTNRVRVSSQISNTAVFFFIKLPCFILGQ